MMDMYGACVVILLDNISSVYVFNYAFLTGSLYGFGKKGRRQMPASSESASNLKNSKYSQQNGQFPHIVWTD